MITGFQSNPVPKPKGEQGNEHLRKRGRAGMAQRKRRLQAEPLCRHCAVQGLTTPSTVPDHIIPLKDGGTDDDTNIQCLCEQCHAIKTAIEAAQGTGASNHPDWLRPSAIPLTIVCGPPCAGKTTYVEQNAKPGDITIDLDALARKIDPSYRQWEGMLEGALLNSAIRARNELLGSLSRLKRGNAWFIVSAPTQAERNWWQDHLCGNTHLIDPGADECKRRAIQRGTPNAVKGIDEWHRRARQQWQPKGKAQTFTEQGRVVW
ncbi:HNH endonuclease [Pelagibacterium sp.]|uniref:HNH endonuclease n=1 Tax=Pelagibacterium sp. TaxID=1967288 RepID=UPI003A8D1E1B